MVIKHIHSIQSTISHPSVSKSLLQSESELMSRAPVIIKERADFWNRTTYWEHGALGSIPESFSEQLSIVHSSLTKGRNAHPPSACWNSVSPDPCKSYLCSQPLWVHVCSCPAVSRKHCLLVVIPICVSDILSTPPSSVASVLGRKVCNVVVPSVGECATICSSLQHSVLVLCVNHHVWNHRKGMMKLYFKF